MGTAPAEDYAPIASAWDFSRAKVVADLGGGGGSLILAVLGLNPHLRGMLVDLEPAWMRPNLASRRKILPPDAN
jgi:predicted RNA methylase